MEHAAHVDAAGKDLVAGFDFARRALAGEGGGIERRASAGDDAVDGHFLAGLDDDDRAGGDLVGIDALEAAVSFDVGVIGADIHEGADAAAAFADGVALEQFAGLVEEHDGDGLGVVAVLVNGQRHGADRGHGHEEILVEDLAVFDALERFAENVVADGQIRHEIKQEARRAGSAREVQGGRHRRRGDDAQQRVNLFPVHGISLREAFRRETARESRFDLDTNAR